MCSEKKAASRVRGCVGTRMMWENIDENMACFGRSKHRIRPPLRPNTLTSVLSISTARRDQRSLKTSIPRRLRGRRSGMLDLAAAVWAVWSLAMGASIGVLSVWPEVDPEASAEADGEGADRDATNNTDPPPPARDSDPDELRRRARGFFADEFSSLSASKPESFDFDPGILDKIATTMAARAELQKFRRDASWQVQRPPRQLGLCIHEEGLH